MRSVTLRSGRRLAVEAEGRSGGAHGGKGGDPGIDPLTGEAPADFTAQARQAFTDLDTVLRAAGSGLEHVVKTTVFLTDATKFTELNALFAEAFPADPPTRATPVVALPRNLQISIECIAVMP